MIKKLAATQQQLFSARVVKLSYRAWYSYHIESANPQYTVTLHNKSV